MLGASTIFKGIKTSGLGSSVIRVPHNFFGSIHAGSYIPKTPVADNIFSKHFELLSSLNRESISKENNNSLMEEIGSTSRGYIKAQRKALEEFERINDFDNFKPIIDCYKEYFDSQESLINELDSSLVLSSNLDSELGIHGLDDLVKVQTATIKVLATNIAFDHFKIDEEKQPTIEEKRREAHVFSIYRMVAQIAAILEVNFEYFKFFANNFLYLRQGFFYNQHPELLALAEEEGNKAHWDLAFGARHDSLCRGEPY